MADKTLHGRQKTPPENELVDMSYNLIRPQLLTNDWSEANANHLTVCVLLRTRSTVPYHTVSSPTHTHTDRLVLWWLVSCSRVQRTTHGAESHIDRHVQCAHIRHKTWASRSCHRAGAQKRATFELAFVIREREYEHAILGCQSAGFTSDFVRYLSVPPLLIAGFWHLIYWKLPSPVRYNLACTSSKLLKACILIFPISSFMIQLIT